MKKFENLNTRNPKEQPFTKLDYMLKPEEQNDLFSKGKLECDFNESVAWGDHGLAITEGDTFKVELVDDGEKIIKVESIKETL